MNILTNLFEYHLNIFGFEDRENPQPKPETNKNISTPIFPKDRNVRIYDGNITPNETA